MSTLSWLGVLVALYFLFTTILWNTFHNMLSILGAAILAAIAGLLISLVVKGRKG